MNRFLMVTALSVATCLAAVPQGGNTKAAVKAPAIQVIPQDAVAHDDGTWTYTDKQHRNWIYTKTPFGIARVPAVAAAGMKQPEGIPAGAHLNANGTYSWTGKDGKPWTFEKTPFGISRYPATPSASPQAVAMADQAAAAPDTREPDIKTIDQGDTVRFERKGLMGTSVWEKKKSEMSEEEKRMLASQHVPVESAGSQK